MGGGESESALNRLNRNRALLHEWRQIPLTSRRLTPYKVQSTLWMAFMRILALLLATLLMFASAAVCEHSVGPSHEKGCVVCALGRMPCSAPSPMPFLPPQAEAVWEVCALRLCWPALPPGRAHSGRSPPSLHPTVA